MFAAEKSYIDKLSVRSLADVTSIPDGDIEAFFLQSTKPERFEGICRNVPHPGVGCPAGSHKELNSVLTATPRKIVVHILLHEIRHWAHIATLFRLNGLVDDFHDFLFSPVMGGELRREQVNT